MSTQDVFIKQAKSNIHDWKHELIELEARAKRAAETPDQLKVSTQRIIQLKSQIATAEKQIQEVANS